MSQHPYAYCDGDPVNNSDPSGHDANADAIAAIGILLMVAIGIAFLPEAVILATAIELRLAISALIFADGLYTADAVSRSITEHMGHGGNESKEPPDKPKKGIGWQGDKNSSPTMYIPVKGSPGHYIQSGPPISDPGNSNILPPGTPYKKW